MTEKAESLTEVSRQKVARVLNDPCRKTRSPAPSSAGDSPTEVRWSSVQGIRRESPQPRLRHRTSRLVRPEMPTWFM